MQRQDTFNGPQLSCECKETRVFDANVEAYTKGAF